MLSVIIKVYFEISAKGSASQEGDNMKKLTVFGVILAVIVLGLYAREAYELGSLIFNYTDPLTHTLDGAFNRLINAYPWWWLLCSFGTVICGVLAPVLYFCRSVHSIEMAFSAFGLDILTFVLNACFRQSWVTVFAGNWLPQIFLWLLVLVFAGYLSGRKDYSYSSQSGWRFLGSR